MDCEKSIGIFGCKVEETNSALIEQNLLKNNNKLTGKGGVGLHTSVPLVEALFFGGKRLPLAKEALVLTEDPLV